MEIGGYRAYPFKFASGSVLWRNRRYLRRLVEADGGNGGDGVALDRAVDHGSDGHGDASLAAEELDMDGTDSTMVVPRFSPLIQPRNVVGVVRSRG